MDFYSRSVPVYAWFLENCDVGMDMCVHAYVCVCVCAHAYTLVSVYVSICVYIYCIMQIVHGGKLSRFSWIS